MKVVQEEIFGPIVTAMCFDDPDEAITLANDTPSGLAGSIWTCDVSKAHRMVASIRAGLLWINCHGIPDMAVPFGGYKQSGWGRERLGGVGEVYRVKICPHITLKPALNQKVD